MRFFLFSTLIFLFFQVNTSGQEGLEADDFKEILNSSDDVLLLDVQIQEKYQKYRIPGHIRAEEKHKMIKEAKKVNKDTKILIYCTKGKRSAQAVKLLKEEGFSNIFHLEGGIKKWIEEGYPVDKSKIEIPFNHN